jgi:hypothetical protein
MKIYRKYRCLGSGHAPYMLGSVREIRTCKIMVLKHEGKKPLGRPRCRLQDDIKTDLLKMECEDVDYIQMVQDSGRTHANTGLKFRVPLIGKKFLVT